MPLNPNVYYNFNICWFCLTQLIQFFLQLGHFKPQTVHYIYLVWSLNIMEETELSNSFTRIYTIRSLKKAV